MLGPVHSTLPPIYLLHLVLHLPIRLLRTNALADIKYNMKLLSFHDPMSEWRAFLFYSLCVRAFLRLFPSSIYRTSCYAQNGEGGNFPWYLLPDGKCGSHGIEFDQFDLFAFLLANAANALQISISLINFCRQPYHLDCRRLVCARSGTFAGQARARSQSLWGEFVLHAGSSRFWAFASRESASWTYLVVMEHGGTPKCCFYNALEEKTIQWMKTKYLCRFGSLVQALVFTLQICLPVLKEEWSEIYIPFWTLVYWPLLLKVLASKHIFWSCTVTIFWSLLKIHVPVSKSSMAL